MLDPEFAHVLGQRLQDEAANEGTCQGPHPTNHGHADYQPRLHDQAHLRAGQPDKMHVKPPGQSAYEAAQGKGKGLPPNHIHTSPPGCHVIITDALQKEADLGFNQQIEKDLNQDNHHEECVVIRQVPPSTAIELRNAQSQVATRDVIGKPYDASGNFCESNRGKGQVRTPQAKAYPPEKKPYCGCRYYGH